MSLPPESESPLRALPVAAAVVALALSCAHKPRAGTLDTLKTAVEAFHRSLRWNDTRGAAQLVAPERRADFLKIALANHDEENLKITEYELEDAQLVKGGATVLSKLTWYRMPSVTLKSDLLTSTWDDREGVWFVTSIEGGPLLLEKKAAPAADGGEEPPPAVNPAP